MGLCVSGVSSGYGRIQVLREISFEVENGQILGVVGRNGMGKSTLIRTLAGLNVPTSGEITFEGQDITKLPAHIRAQRGIATIMQGRGIFPRLTVRENLEMGRVASGKVRHDHSHEVFNYFPRLKERLRQAAGTLSGGEQQMLAIGRGLMTDPKVMLLDEPSDGIMPSLVQQIAEILVTINRNRGMTILIVEQNVPMIMKMASECIILENGRVIASGSTKELFASGVAQEHLAL